MSTPWTLLSGLLLTTSLKISSCCGPTGDLTTEWAAATTPVTLVVESGKHIWPPELGTKSPPRTNIYYLISDGMSAINAIVLFVNRKIAISLILLCSGKILYPALVVKYVLPLSRVTSIHYNDVIMSTIASQVTSVSIVCSTVCSGAGKLQSSASLTFVWGIHWWPVIPCTKGQ